MKDDKLIVKECRAFNIGEVEYLSEEKDILVHMKVLVVLQDESRMLLLEEVL